MSFWTKRQLHSSIVKHKINTANSRNKYVNDNAVGAIVYYQQILWQIPTLSFSSRQFKAR